MSDVTATTATTTRPAADRRLTSRLIAVVVGLAMAIALIIGLVVFGSDSAPPTTQTPATVVEPSQQEAPPVLDSCLRRGRPC